MDQGFTEEQEGEGIGDAGNKICRSLCMVCLGMVALPLSLFLLAWNENNYVCEHKRILYAETKANVVGCDSTGVEDEFVFLSCPVLDASLMQFTPCTFQTSMACGAQPPVPISFQSASGEQTVEMYQCDESCTTSTKKSKNMLGQNTETKVTECTYNMKWDSAWIDSARFKYPLDQIAMRGCPDISRSGGNPNPPDNLDMGTSTEYAQTIVVGSSETTGFTLNKALVNTLTPNTPVSMLPYQSVFFGFQSNTSMPWMRPLSVSTSNLGVAGNYLKTCSMDAIGCVRVAYLKSGATNPSVITHVSDAGQTGEQTVPGSWGCEAAGWQAIQPAKMDKAAMVELLHATNSAMTWILRLLGCLAAWLSVYCCLSPISAAADVLGDFINYCPCGGFLEDILEGVVDAVICCMSCGVGCSCALFVIALVWVFMRPMVGGALMVVAICMCACVAGVRSQVEGRKSARRKDFHEADSGQDARPLLDLRAVDGSSRLSQPAPACPSCLACC